MPDSAKLKINRATKHILELNELFREERPFVFIVETDRNAGKRTAFVKENKPVICAAAAICGDVVHNLRSGLDHAYWDIVAPFVPSAREQRNIQFPFSETAARLEEAIKNRLAERVSPRFFKALVNLKPHGDTGGNKLLYLIHQFDTLDKHRLLIPTCDYTGLSGSQIQRLLPDIPIRTGENNLFLSSTTIRWNITAQTIDVGIIKPPTTHIFEKELPIPVNIIFKMGPMSRDTYPVIPTLNKLVDVSRKTIEAIRAAA